MVVPEQVHELSKSKGEELSPVLGKAIRFQIGRKGTDVDSAAAGEQDLPVATCAQLPLATVTDSNLDTCASEAHDDVVVMRVELEESLRDDQQTG